MIAGMRVVMTAGMRMVMTAGRLVRRLPGMLMAASLPLRMLVGMPVGMLLRVLAAVLMAVCGLAGPCLLRIGPLERAAVEQHPEAGAGEAAAGRAAALDPDACQAEAGDRLRDHLERHPEVETGTEEHVPGDAARAVEMVAGHPASVSPLPPYQAPRSRSDTQRPVAPSTR